MFVYSRNAGMVLGLLARPYILVSLTLAAIWVIYMVWDMARMKVEIRREKIRKGQLEALGLVELKAYGTEGVGETKAPGMDLGLEYRAPANTLGNVRLENDRSMHDQVERGIGRDSVGNRDRGE